ncbi:MAG: exodeoxyribonuclease VII small subunit [Parcubacteria group bacterium CG2_30_48_51]|nr:MAG: exodeoxyribonuclease VII small subunit [Parcubacteria group bacterium CG2_30_48_51]
MQQKKEKINFSKLLGELETLTHELEADTPDLAEAVKKFERGLAIAQELKTYLTETEASITVLKKKFTLDS